MATWNGEAALAYGSLSEVVAGHFGLAVLASRTAAAVLRGYATELERASTRAPTRCMKPSTG